MSSAPRNGNGADLTQHDAEAMSRKIAATWVALAEVLALLGSGEHAFHDVRNKFDQCAAECLAEFDDPALRDPLATQIQLVRGLVFRAADSIVLQMGGGIVDNKPE